MVRQHPLAGLLRLNSAKCLAQWNKLRFRPEQAGAGDRAGYALSR
jgi:hypothetical protein